MSSAMVDSRQSQTDSSATSAETDRLDAFESVMAEHQRAVFRTLLAIVHDEPLADSLTQETFVKAWKSRKSFRGDGELKSWLMRIAVNLARDELRRRKRWWTISPTEEPVSRLRDESPTADALVEAGQIGRAIREALETLSARQRVVFALRHYEGRSLEEIAAMIGMKPATARVHLHRATARMRRELAHWRAGGKQS